MLYLDVDGVLSPYAHQAPTWDDWRRIDHAPYHLVLSESMATRLDRLEAEIVWLTTWEDQANHYVGSALGWDALDVVGRRRGPADRWWKLEALRRRIRRDPHPFVWVDDELERRARMVEPWLDELGIPHLLVSPDPETGLSSAELDEIERFVSDIRDDQ